MRLIRYSLVLCALALAFGTQASAQELRNRVLAQSASGAFKIEAMQSFDTLAVLGVVTGKSLNGISGIHQVFQFVLGHKVLNTNLPYHRPAVTELILRQYPEFKAIDPSAINRDNVQQWNQRFVKTYGASLVLVRAK